MATRKMKRYNGETGSRVYEDDAPELPSGRTQMSDPYEDAAEANRARAIAEGEKISEGERVASMAASAKPAKAEKAKIVTKEELEKSGLSLRDYLNKQQGLTRREAAKPAMSDAEAMAKKMVPRFNPAGAAPKQTMGRQPQPFMPGSVDNSFPGAKFKDGGKVRSASSRADGIAIRGKTRA
jgi:hypothetical protein